MILATKGGHPELTTMHVSRLSRSEIRHDVHQSLKNLQTDAIDLYWLHRDDESRPVEEIVETLAGEVQAGTIRYFGCSNWRLDRIKAAQDYAGGQGRPGFVANQLMWSLAVPDADAMPDRSMVAMDDELRRYHLETGLPAMAYSSQASGWFYRTAPEAGGQADEGAGRLYGHAANEGRLRRLRQLATESGLSLSEIVLGYLRSQPFPTIPIVGCETIDEVRDSLRAADVTLSPRQLDYLERG